MKIIKRNYNSKNLSDLIIIYFEKMAVYNTWYVYIPRKRRLKWTLVYI